MLQRLFKQAFVLFILSFSINAFADRLIIEPEMGRAPILDLINETKHSLKLVMYGMTDETLLNAIIQKKLQRKTVNVILEPTPYKAENENRKAIAAFKQHDLNWKTLKSVKFTHQKTLLIDNQKVLIMTFNFTRSAFKNDRNFGLVIDDPKRVKAILALFSADWNNVTPPSSPHLIVSPDNSREQLIALIDAAKTRIQIYAQSASDYKIIGALAKAARRGVKVEILTSAKWREKQSNYLAKAGVILKKSEGYYIHAKVFIFDERQAVIGSINLTRNSLDHNRELAVVTDDKIVIKQLSETFGLDWHKASASSPSAKDYIPDKKMLLKTLRQIEKMVDKYL